MRTTWAKQRFSRDSYASYRPGQLAPIADYFWIESDGPEERREVSFGNLIFDREQLCDAFYGFMNGGAETGRLATNLVVRSIDNQSPSRGTKRHRLVAAKTRPSLPRRMSDLLLYPIGDRDSTRRRRPERG